MGAFEKVVAQLTLIVAFQSLILDMAGNVGTQSLAVTIRVLTDGGLTAKQKFRLVSKEMRVGLLNGTLIGVLSFIAVGLYIFFFKGKGLVYSFAMSGCIGISLILAIIVSSAVGTLTPLSSRNKDRPCRCVRPYDNHAERSGGSCGLLWN